MVVILVFALTQKKKNNNLILSNNNRTVEKKNGSTEYNTVACTKWIKAGGIKIRFRIDNNRQSRWIFIGIVTRKYTSYNAGSSYIGQRQGEGYGITTGGGSPYRYPGGHRWGELFEDGDILTLNLNMTKKVGSWTRLSSKTNKVSDLGKAWDILEDEVCVAVTLYNVNDKVTLLGGMNS